MNNLKLNKFDIFNKDKNKPNFFKIKHYDTKSITNIK